jgi:hypothetical protein
MTDTHGGPFHEVKGKSALNAHLDEWHESADGFMRHVEYPDSAGRSKWRQDELKESHRRLHEGGEPG